MARATSIATSGSVDTSDLKAFIRALRKASPTAARGMRTRMRAAGAIVATEAKAIASQHSDSIPPTIHTTVYGASVAVRAGKGVALAAIYELGNKGSGGRDDGSFRHPVFEQGDDGLLQETDAWVDQDRWAFLKPAAEAKGVELEAEIMKLADEVADVITGNWGM